MAREFVLLGDPVGHSLSPRLHGAAFEHWGVDATYRAQRVGRSELNEAVRAAAATGGGNVTLPHKAAVAGLLDRPGPEVVATGACNCFWATATGDVAGDNTDVGGFLRALRDFDVQVSGASVLVLGAGGAARAVLRALHHLDVDRVDLWNRTAARARQLAARTPGRVDVLDALPTEADYELVVNATSRGLHPGDALPIDLSGGVAAAALDLVYAPGGTAWVAHAARSGVPARDGLGMLVHQAALSLERWFPDREPPLKEMFAAVRDVGSTGPSGVPAEP